MSKPDAQRTLTIYRTFVKQTDNVVKYLSVARNYEHVTRLEIPTLKHAPTVLTNQLEDYVRDGDFEVMREQYIAGQGNRKKGGDSGTGAKASSNGNGASSSKDAAQRMFEEQTRAVSGGGKEAFPEPKTAARSAAKGPAPDMVDFFESIEQNQTTMNTNPFQQQQQTGFGGQQMPQGTGFGQQQDFGIQQPGGMPQQQNSFMLQAIGMPQQQNQFGVPQQPQIQNSPFGIQNTGMPQQQQSTFSPMQSQATGNPFAPQQPQQATSPQTIQPNFTGAGFGGYTPAQPQQNTGRFQPALSSIPQNSPSSFPSQPQLQSQQPNSMLSPISPFDSQQSSNPFRQSMLPTATGQPSPFAPMQTGSPMQNSNPFAKPQATGTPSHNGGAFGQPQAAQPLVPAATGTNPFALSRPANTGSPAGVSGFGSPAQGVSTNVTGSTNPFRRSEFVNQSTCSLIPDCFILGL